MLRKWVIFLIVTWVRRFLMHALLSCHDGILLIMNHESPVTCKEQHRFDVCVTRCQKYALCFKQCLRVSEKLRSCRVKALPCQTNQNKTKQVFPQYTEWHIYWKWGGEPMERGGVESDSFPCLYLKAAHNHCRAAADMSVCVWGLIKLHRDHQALLLQHSNTLTYSGKVIYIQTNQDDKARQVPKCCAR